MAHKKIMKLITVMVLIAAILLPGSIFASVDIMQDSSQQFKDINQYSWAKDAINYFGRAGIINGDGKGNYMPGKNVSREEFAAMLANAFNTDMSVSGQTFSDVPLTRWSYKAIESTKDYLTGYYPPKGGKAFFDPGGKATREDVAVALAKILGFTGDDLDNSDILEENYLDANQVSLNLRDIVGVVVEQKIMVGSGKYLRPTASITRAEVAVLLYKVLKGTVTDAKDPLKLTVNVPEVTNEAELTITGATQPGARVKVNGFDVKVDSDGQFEVTTTLKDEGNYELEVVAIKNGRKAVVKKTVDYQAINAGINLPNFPDTSETQYVSINGTLTGVDYSSDFTINGEEVYFSSEHYGSGTYEFTYYAELKDGTNPFVFSVKNKNGKVTTLTKVITFAQAAPELNITNCPATSEISSVTISGTVKDKVDLYPSVYINNQKIYTSWDNSWSKKVTLSEGKNVFVIKAVNSSGKTTEFTKEIVYTATDSVAAPELTFSNCPSTSAESTVTISGNVSDSVDKWPNDPPKVYINGASVDVIWWDNYSWSKTVTLSEGTNTFVIKATNSRGKSKEVPKTIMYSLDAATPPDLIITNCPETSTSNTVTISGTISDSIDKWPNPVPSVYVNDQIANAFSIGNTWSRTVTLTEGANSIVIRATNSKGKTREITRVIYYTSSQPSTDQQVPNLSVNVPNSTSSLFLYVSGTVSDSVDADPATIPVTVNGMPVSVDSSGNFGQMIILNEGSNEVTVKAVNSRGNSAERKIYVTYTP